MKNGKMRLAALGHNQAKKKIKSKDRKSIPHSKGDTKLERNLTNNWTSDGK